MAGTTPTTVTKIVQSFLSVLIERRVLLGRAESGNRVDKGSARMRSTGPAQEYGFHETFGLGYGDVDDCRGRRHGTEHGDARMTQHALITFLGRGRQSPTQGYRPADYRFPDQTIRSTPYFGLALADHLQPDRLVILGTSGSMWGVLLEDHVAADAHEDLRLAIAEAEIDQRIDQALVDRIAPVLAQSLGREVSARLIPPARDLDEQIDILETFASAAEGCHRVSIDLTHGFRHFGMLGFLSGFMLERIQRMELDGLWYGALELTGSTRDGTTPVLRLDGLHAVEGWISALERFDAAGDYGVFAPLLQAEGMPSDKADCLRRASFHEATMNIPDAAQQIRSALPALEQPLQGAAELFRERLIERLKWARMKRLSAQQRHLAMRALQRGDYQRCATLGLEAVITHHCESEGLDPLDYDHRETVRNEQMEEARANGRRDPHAEALLGLNQLRNALAHGTPPNFGPMQQVIRNPDRLGPTLQSMLDRLLT